MQWKVKIKVRGLKWKRHMLFTNTALLIRESALKSWALETALPGFKFQF